MARPRKPDPEVLEGDYRIPAAVGSLGWAVALVVLLVFNDALAPDDRWWIWVCVVGMLLGLIALVYIPFLHRRRAAAEERRARQRERENSEHVGSDQ